jgi:hypothetical protein
MLEEVVMTTADAVGQDATIPAGYPSAWEFDGLLRSGGRR